MCKIISSDIVIGNFVIEAVEKDDFEIELKKIYDFDTKLSKELIKHDYYTKFDPINVIEFQENYPFFIKSINESLVCVDDSNKKDYLMNMLIRYFRIGIPKIVAQEMKTISQTILE